jgi:hypothetical protein
MDIVPKLTSFPEIAAHFQQKVPITFLSKLTHFCRFGFLFGMDFVIFFFRRFNIHLRLVSLSLAWLYHHKYIISFSAHLAYRGRG